MRNIEEVIINGGITLEEILDKHEKWLNEEEGGERAELVKVDLSDVNLSGVNLFDADLYNTDLTNADLTEANLSYANLRGANLRYANLKYANLRGADLRNADLSFVNLKIANLNKAYLSSANLCEANLKCANLINAKLRYANLSEANLICVDLTDADLTRADLSYANLMGANLQLAILDNVIYNECTSFFALQCPEKGSFIGYKKARGKIVELLITEDAKRSNATTRKCRCSKAKVLSISNEENTKKYEKVHSDFDYSFIYKVGEIVEVKDFDEDRWEECSTGIHFFLTRDEAVRY